MLAVIGDGHGFRETLGLVVAASRADAVDVSPVILGLRVDQRVAVDFRRGSEQEPRGLEPAESERLVGAERANLQGLDRELEIIDRAGWRGKMPDTIDPALEEKKLGDVLLDEFEMPVAGQVRNVIDAAGHQVVDGDDGMPFQKQIVHQVRSEKTSPAGHDGNGFRGTGVGVWIDGAESVSCLVCRDRFSLRLGPLPRPQPGLEAVAKMHSPR